MEKPDESVTARLFWTGGGQALRLPKSVCVRRMGTNVLVEPVTEEDGWDGFWARLVPLGDRIRRGPTRSAERRRRV